MNRLDDADLVLIASVATGIPADDVLDGCDVAALATVVATAEAAEPPSGTAAALLLAMDRHRPFAQGNLAAAWLAAAHLFAAEGLHLRVDHHRATALLGCDDVDGLAATLASLAVPRATPVRRALRWLVEPWPATGPSSLPCPTCGRPLALVFGDACLLRGPWAASADFELRARCAANGGSHDRSGRPIRVVADDRVLVGAS